MNNEVEKTWVEKVADLRVALGREPTLDELFEESKKHKMTWQEVADQRASWARQTMD